jgi:tripartite-type tricarboxylate transporter receptor subunit TctC
MASEPVGRCTAAHPRALVRRVAMMTRVVGCLVAAVVGLGAVQANAQQNFPNRPLRIIVPFPAGGLNDTAARLIQPYLEKALGQTVLIDNRPGASGIVGTDFVVKSPPDGHTLLMVASSHTVVPATNPKLPFDAVKDLTAVALVGANPFLFVVGSKVPAQTLAEFVALAKSRPGALNYATVGAASQSHLVTELFSRRAGIKMQHIPYRGGAPAITAMMSGDTQFTVISPLASLPHIQSGALRAIAAGSTTRDPQFPAIPTVAESYPGFEALQWVGLLTTAGTPKDIIARINAEVNRALREPDLIAKLAAQGVSPAPGSPDDFQKRIVTEIREWTEVAQEANIRAE